MGVAYNIKRGFGVGLPVPETSLEKLGPMGLLLATPPHVVLLDLPCSAQQMVISYMIQGQVKQFCVSELPIGCKSIWFTFSNKNSANKSKNHSLLYGEGRPRLDTSIVRLFVIHNSRSGSLSNKIGCRNNLTHRDLKIYHYGLLSVNYTGAVIFF